MDTSLVQGIKLGIVSATGLSKDALHIYVGLTVFLGVLWLRRRRPCSILPWASVLLLAVLGELVDMRDDLASLGYWRWDASLHDILNTLFWPTVLWFWLVFGSRNAFVGGDKLGAVQGMPVTSGDERQRGSPPAGGAEG